MLGKMTPLAYQIHGKTDRANLSNNLVLVLLHAYPLDSSMWDEVIDRVHAEDPKLPILTIDAPGFGESASGAEVARRLGVAEEPSLDTFAAGIEATLDSLGVSELVMVGLSLGGYAALAYADAYPQRIRGVGLLDTKAESDPEPARKVRLATAAKVLVEGTAVLEESVNTVLGPTTRATRPDVVERLRKEILAAPAEAVAWIQRAMAVRPDRLHVLEGLRVPGIVLRGDEDELSSAEAAEAMATALGSTPAVLGAAGVITLSGVGHMSANEAPEQVASALIDLYSRVRAV